MSSAVARWDATFMSGEPVTVDVSIEGAAGDAADLTGIELALIAFDRATRATLKSATVVAAGTSQEIGWPGSYTRDLGANARALYPNGIGIMVCKVLGADTYEPWTNGSLTIEPGPSNVPGSPSIVIPGSQIFELRLTAKSNKLVITSRGSPGLAASAQLFGAGLIAEPTVAAMDARNRAPALDAAARVQTATRPVAAGLIAPPSGFMRLAGYVSAGDGGGALYKAVGAEPTHGGKLKLVDNSWLELSESIVSPLMFGAHCDGTVHLLSERYATEAEFQAALPYAWATWTKYLKPYRAALNASDPIVFPGVGAWTELSTDWAGLAECFNGPFPAKRLDGKLYLVTDFLPIETKSGSVAWGGATIKAMRKTTRGNIVGAFESTNFTSTGQLTVDANLIAGENCITWGQALRLSDDGLIPDAPPDLGTGSETIDTSQVHHVRVINARWRDLQPGSGGGKGVTLQQGYRGVKIIMEAIDCDWGLTVEGRDSYKAASGGYAAEAYIAAANNIEMYARNCARGAAMLAAPTTPAPTNPLANYGMFKIMSENCGIEYGDFGVLNFDRGFCCDVELTVVSKPNGQYKTQVLPAAVNVSASTITIPAHGWRTGDPLVYASTAAVTIMLIGGLTQETKYYAVVVDANTIMLATSKANALAGTTINLTSAGATYKGQAPLHFFENVGTEVAIDFAPSAVETATGRITLPNHGMRLGYKFQLSSTGALPGGVTTATDYWAFVVDANTIRIARDRSSAVKPLPDNSFAASAIDVAADTIAIPNHGYKNNDTIFIVPGATGPTLMVTASDNSTSPSLVSSPRKYYIIRVSKDVIALAETTYAVTAGARIDITSAGSGTHLLTGCVVLTSQGSGTHTLVRRRSTTLIAGTPRDCRIRVNGIVDSLETLFSTANVPNTSNHSTAAPKRNDIQARVTVRGESYGPAVLRELVSSSTTGGLDTSDFRLTLSKLYAEFVGLPSTAEAFYYNCSATVEFNVADKTNNRRVYGASKTSTNIRTDKSDWNTYRNYQDGSTAFNFLNSFEITITNSRARVRDITSGVALYLGGSGSPEGAVSAPAGSIFMRGDGAAGTLTYVKGAGTGNTGWVAKW